MKGSTSSDAVVVNRYGRWYVRLEQPDVAAPAATTAGFARWPGSSWAANFTRRREALAFAESLGLQVLA